MLKLMGKKIFTILFSLIVFNYTYVCIPGFNQGQITDEKYKSFLRQIQGKLETMKNNTTAVKVRPTLIKVLFLLK